MSNDIATQIDAAAWESKTDLIRRTVAAGASPDELEMFFHQARRSGLDPLNKEIYFVKRQGKGTVQLAIDGLLKIAHRTGLCAGIDDTEYIGTTERGFPAAAKVVVYKLVGGIRCPFGATARWEEYFPGDQQGFQWKRMPHVMLGKCALALALRKAFPLEAGGLYVHEEMEQAGTTENAAQPAQSALPQPVAPLAGAELVQAAKEAFGGQNNAPANDGKEAFGYVPMRWPVPKMFSEPATESQSKMFRAKCRERMMDMDELPVVQRLVLGAYGIEDDGSKAAMSLLIDWAMNAEDDALDLASSASEAQPRPELELS